ncbi:Uncharacterised protein [uncultured archaeon]|nr:Uncharacterised protein [uncultured archaeon]
MHVPKPKKVIPINVPPPMDIDEWIVIGIDPSLSRTGFAISHIQPSGQLTGHKWLTIGSVKPDSAKEPIWIRGKAMAL